MSNDKYRNFSELQSAETEGTDYRISLENRSTKWLILAPHGGGIEPGTSEIARAVAGSCYSYYLFEGIKSKSNSSLHITSEFFDEERADTVLCTAEYALAFHGCAGYDGKILIGGLDIENRLLLADILKRSGFDAENNPPIELSGMKSDNICNRALSGKGIQIELDLSVRRNMFRGLNRSGRSSPQELFFKFVAACKNFLDSR